MTAIAERVDTQPMVIVHRVFRREFRLLPALVQQVPAGDRVRAAVVADHAADMTSTLHHHHSGEDLLLWPTLLARAAPRAELIQRMQAQHERIAVLLDRVDVLMAQWLTSADPATRDELARMLAQTSAALDEHLGDEETEILPLVAEHITMHEWDALLTYGKKALPKNSKAFVLLGLIFEETTAAERAAFLRDLPVPVRWAWRLIGHRIYRRAMIRLRDTTRWAGPHLPARPHAAVPPVALGALLGIVWAASLRGWMMQQAAQSSFTWSGTFAGVLLPGAVVGALFGWAEHQRRTGRRRAWLILAPLLFPVAALSLPGGISKLLATGQGSGAIGIALLGMLGGASLSGRGPRWLRLISGAAAFSLVPASFLGPTMRPELDTATPYGAWASTTFAALFVTLALACTIPLRPERTE